jgi:uncharacterized protein (TIGR00369 family)
MDGSAPEGFTEAVGVEWLEVGPETARGRVAVTAWHMQPFGIVHGGVYSTLSESLASAATYEAVKGDGKVAMGQASDTSYLRPITEGHVNAVARRRHGGSTTWIWDVELSDDEGRLCAVSRMTIAVRPARR